MLIISELYFAEELVYGGIEAVEEGILGAGHETLSGRIYDDGSCSHPESTSLLFFEDIRNIAGSFFCSFEKLQSPHSLSGGLVE